MRLDRFCRADRSPSDAQADRRRLPLDHSLLPVLGSLLVVFADLAARMVHPPYETPLGALIALLGVPFFLYLARKERREL